MFTHYGDSWSTYIYTHCKQSNSWSRNLSSLMAIYIYILYYILNYFREVFTRIPIKHWSFIWTHLQHSSSWLVMTIPQEKDHLRGRIYLASWVDLKAHLKIGKTYGKTGEDLPNKANPLIAGSPTSWAMKRLSLEADDFLNRGWIGVEFLPFFCPLDPWIPLEPWLKLTIGWHLWLLHSGNFQ